MIDDGRIAVEREGTTVVVTIDRPDSGNALTPTMMADLVAAMDEFERDDSLIVAILTAAGGRSFCTGGDLRSTIPHMRRSGMVAGSGSDPETRFFSNVFKPIIAEVRGHCIAGGVEIMLGTDIRLASPSARFGLPEVRWGLVPSGGSHVRLPRQIPWAVAMEMLLVGQTIGAERAREIGLVNDVIDEEKLHERALELAATIAKNGPFAVRRAKEIAVRSMALERAFALEADLAAAVWQSDDVQEGIRAFAERREPDFSGH